MDIKIDFGQYEFEEMLNQVDLFSSCHYCTKGKCPKCKDPKDCKNCNGTQKRGKGKCRKCGIDKDCFYCSGTKICQICKGNSIVTTSFGQKILDLIEETIEKHKNCKT